MVRAPFLPAFPVGGQCQQGVLFSLNTNSTVQNISKIKNAHALTVDRTAYVNNGVPGSTSSKIWIFLWIVLQTNSRPAGWAGQGPTTRKSRGAGRRAGLVREGTNQSVVT